jgi:integrase
MPRSPTDLTEAFVRTATSDGKPDRLIADSRQANLYFRVLVSGRKSWQLRARVGGRWVVETLGPWGVGTTKARTGIDVRQARLLAAGALRKHLHPSAVRKSDLTVQEAANQWYAERVATRYKTPEQTLAYLVRDLAPLHRRPIAKVRRGELIALVAAKPPTAGNRLLAILKQFFRYAVTCEWLDQNPLAEVTRRNVGHEERPRERVLSDDEIRKAWALPAPHGTLYRMLLATGQRVGEVLDLAENPENFGEKSWDIPDNKSQRPHRLPLTPMMRSLQAEGLPDKKRCAAWQYWKKYTGSDATLHDMRRTVATRMRELGVGIEAIEALLNHAPARLVRTYQRPDMQPQIEAALLRWQGELARVVGGIEYGQQRRAPSVGP